MCTLSWSVLCADEWGLDELPEVALRDRVEAGRGLVQ